jgi:hypothetical protein
MTGLIAARNPWSQAFQVATRVNSAAPSIRSGRFPRNLIWPQSGLEGSARRSGVSGKNSGPPFPAHYLTFGASPASAA